MAAEQPSVTREPAARRVPAGWTSGPAVPAGRTVFVRKAEWKTGPLTGRALTAWLRRPSRARDYVLLGLLSDHHYLTTDQVQALFFPSRRAAQMALRWLAAEVRMVMRWPQLEPMVRGAASAPIFSGWRARPWLHMLTERGAAAVATNRAADAQALIRRSWYTAEHIQHLEHRVHTNGFWIDLAAAARELDDHGLYS